MLGLLAKKPMGSIGIQAISRHSRLLYSPLIRQSRFVSDVELLKSNDAEVVNDEAAQITGVMDYLKQKEILIFFDNVYPRWLARLSYRKWFWALKKAQQLFTDENLKDRVCQLVDSKNNRLPDGTICETFVPLRRDGGAFVKFIVPPTSSISDLTKSIEHNIQANREFVKEPWYMRLFSQPPRAYKVKGVPWIEDLSRFPSRKLKVMFEGEGLSEEELYLLFRRYGLILDIVPANSTTPYAVIDFKTTDACIRAKNCVTGMTIHDGKTTLHLQYIPLKRVNHLTQFLGNHQRITIPIILALLAALAVFIFEPIREQFIELKIRNYYSWDAHKDNWIIKLISTPYQIIVGKLNDGRHFLDDSLGTITGTMREELDVDNLNQDMIWTERAEKANQLRLWVCENVNTFIIVKGPRGSGKREFVVDHALTLNSDFSKRVLEIDCDSLQKARNDTAFLKLAASQVGYFPLFTWTNSVSQFLDLGMQGLVGQKSGLSELKESQFKNILQLTQTAIRKVALSDYEKYRCEYQRQQQKIANDANSDAKVVDLKEDEYIQMHPHVKPVVVINNFLRKSNSPNDFLYKAIADFAGQLIQSNTAHVIFISSDSGSILHLASALPNQVFKSISLADASQLSAKTYIQKQLRGSEEVSNLEACVKPLGGRMLDLQAFVRRIKSGESSEDALREMIHQASEQITTFFLSSDVSKSDGEATWTAAQIWGLIKKLSLSDNVTFDELLRSPLFPSAQDTVATLGTLEKNDLISLRRDKGLIVLIATGRPLYKAAFQELVGDPTIFKLYETYYFQQLIAVENSKLAKLEDQAARLSLLHDQKLLKDRMEYICGKIQKLTDNIKSYEQSISEISTSRATKKSIFGF